MKRIICIAIILLGISVSHAQTDTTFYKHEVRVSVGEGFLPSVFSLLLPTEVMYSATFSVSYLYRPIKWLWVGGNFVNCLGAKIYYDWREYYPDGNYRDFTKSKRKYYAALAPEVRFSMLNKKYLILYGALSVGVGFEDGYDSKAVKYPKIFPYFQITPFGISGNVGKNKNIFIGGEVGIGYRSFFSVHGGYRF